MRTRNRFILAGLISTLLLPQVASAQVPNLVSYQGRVAVGTTNFEGTGQFKFALVNAAGTTVYWGNAADTTPADGVPDTAVSLAVSKGVYSVLLGDASLTNMAAIPASVWANPDVRLRVWFNDGVNGNQLLTPDQRLAPNGYVADGSVGGAAIATGAITNTKFAAGAVDSPALAGSAVTAAKIASGAVNNAKLATNAVQAANIASGAVTSAKLDSNIVVSGSNYGLGHKLGLQEFSTYIDTNGVWIGSKSNDAVQLNTNNSPYPNMTLATDLNVGISAYEPIVSLTHPNSTLPGQKIYDATTRGLHVDGGDKGVIAIESDNRATLHLRSYNADNEHREFVIRHDSTGKVTFGYPFGLGINEVPVLKLDLSDVTLFENSAGTLRVGSNGTGFVTVQNRLSVDEAQQTPASGYHGVNFGGSSSGEFIASNRTAGSTNRYGLDLYTASQPRLSVTASGNVGVGTQAPKGALHVNGDTYAKGHIFLHAFEGDRTNGTAYVQARDDANNTSVGLTLRTWQNGTVRDMIRMTAGGLMYRNNNDYYFDVSSDRRLKTGIVPIAGALTTLGRINPVRYHYNADFLAKHPESIDKEHYGVIAQEFQEVFPEFVSTDEEGYLSVKADPLIFVAAAAVKELSAKHDAAMKAKDAEIAALKKQLAENDARDKGIEARLAAIEKAAAAQPVKVALTK